MDLFFVYNEPMGLMDIDKLRIITQFSELGSENLKAIAEVCTLHQFKSGDILFQEGEEADSVYLLIEGFVEIWKNYRTGQRDILAKQETGNIVGEMAVIDELKRSATVIAGIDMEILKINRTDFINLLKHLPDLSFEFMKSISMLVRKSNENFINELEERNKTLEKKNRKILQMQDELVQKERLSTVGQFSSMILHDLRNPISVIKGYSDILQIKDCSEEEVKKYSAAIQRETMNLNGLAGEILDFSRGEIRLNLAVTDLNKLLDSVIEIIQRRITGNKIEIEKKLSFSEPILLDYDRFLRVLVNLCDNSRKALYKGGKITIETLSDGKDCLIRVVDDGDGMEKEQLEKVFEPFTSFARSGGTGLGMVIVKNIVEAHKGSILIESERHLGTSVTISLPQQS